MPLDSKSAQNFVLLKVGTGTPAALTAGAVRDSCARRKGVFNLYIKKGEVFRYLSLFSVAGYIARRLRRRRKSAISAASREARGLRTRKSLSPSAASR